MPEATCARLRDRLSQRCCRSPRQRRSGHVCVRGGAESLRSRRSMDSDHGVRTRRRDSYLDSLGEERFDRGLPALTGQARFRNAINSQRTILPAAQKLPARLSLCSRGRNPHQLANWLKQTGYMRQLNIRAISSSRHFRSTWRQNDSSRSSTRPEWDTPNPTATALTILTTSTANCSTCGDTSRMLATRGTRDISQ